jgi:hypothetical protein
VEIYKNGQRRRENVYYFMKKEYDFKEDEEEVQKKS